MAPRPTAGLAPIGRPPPSRSRSRFRGPSGAFLLAVALGAAASWGCAGAPAPQASAGPLAGHGEVVEERPSYATAGWLKPGEARIGCVAEALVRPAGVRHRADVTLKFAVAADGAKDRFEDVSSPAAPPEALAAAIAAVRGCDYTPGFDPAGRPAYVWVVLPLRVGSALPPPAPPPPRKKKS